MIIITGPGRSGTSLLARLYQALGFDPVEGGGGWEDSINGGLEDIEVSRVNLEIIRALRMQRESSTMADLARWVLGPRSPRCEVHLDDPGAPSSTSALQLVLERSIGRRLRLQSWGDLDQVASRLGPRLCELASQRLIVKDPQFCQTLGVWAKAKAPIAQVLISLRDTTATAQGLLRTGHLPTWATHNAPNHVAYRIGLLMAAVVDHRLDYTVLRFPDFLQQPEELYDSLTFPAPVERQQFLEVFTTLVNPELVHSWG